MPDKLHVPTQFSGISPSSVLYYRNIVTHTFRPEVTKKAPKSSKIIEYLEKIKVTCKIHYTMKYNKVMKYCISARPQ